ncbi:phage virion morphogenesis protein [uncultured Pseudacidovorax sp.]|uniref:phage virion morphogenesis protein n=1 Tax=uncultured Pseudacidovorax sp. TaxID=679313 RepID=UPI0025EF6AFF|nr:phage virion morphogenesis protein [uncultured Pseudacidovorax sp.]
MMTVDLAGNGNPLEWLLERLDDQASFLAELGEDLLVSTKQRFVTTTAPDGTPWAPNTPLTLAQYAAKLTGSSLRKKDGSLTTKGETRLASKKPGTGETRMLGERIDYLVQQDDLVVGSPMIYAGTFQFGAKSGEFGFGLYNDRVGSFPIPWGDIPARAFLGLSDADRQTIADLWQTYLLPPPN